MFSPIALNSLSYFFRAKYIFLNSKIDADYVMNKYIVLYGLKHKRGREFSSSSSYSYEQVVLFINTVNHIASFRLKSITLSLLSPAKK